MEKKERSLVVFITQDPDEYLTVINSEYPDGHEEPLIRYHGSGGQAASVNEYRAMLAIAELVFARKGVLRTLLKLAAPVLRASGSRRAYWSTHRTYFIGPIRSWQVLLDALTQADQEINQS